MYSVEMENAKCFINGGFVGLWSFLQVQGLKVDNSRICQFSSCFDLFEVSLHSLNILHWQLMFTLWLNILRIFFEQSLNIFHCQLMYTLSDWISSLCKSPPASFWAKKTHSAALLIHKKNFANPSHSRHQTPLKMTWQIIKWSPFIFRRFQARPKWTNHVVILSLNFITPKNGLSTNDTVVSLPPYNAMMMQMMMIMTRSCRNMIHGGKRKLVEISRDPQGTRWPPAPPHDVDIFSFFVALSSYPLIPLHDNDIFLFVFVFVPVDLPPPPHDEDVFSFFVFVFVFSLCPLTPPNDEDISLCAQGVLWIFLSRGIYSNSKVLGMRFRSLIWNSNHA